MSSVGKEIGERWTTGAQWESFAQQAGPCVGWIAKNASGRSVRENKENTGYGYGNTEHFKSPGLYAEIL